MDYADTLEQLNITLNDTDNVTFTPEQKARALQKAWNDSYVVEDVYDDSLSFTAGTNSYPLPSGFGAVADVGISPSNSLTSDFVSSIGEGLWETQGSNLVFRNNANSVLSSGYTLYLKGRKKLDWNTDTITTPNLQEYVIALAGVNTLTLLAYQKVNLFLKNDTTLGELVALKRELEQDVIRLRGRLQKSFESA